MTRPTPFAARRIAGLLLSFALALLSWRAPAQTFIWAVRAGGAASDGGNSIAVDTAGNSYVTGIFYSTNAMFGGTILTNAGTTDLFVAKYNSAGGLLWAKSAGGTGVDGGNGIAVDAAGNCYVTGYFADTATFGSFVLTNGGVADVFVAKYSTDGDVVWVRQAGGTNYDAGNSIALDTNGNCYVTGYYQNTAAFGPFTLTNGINSDVFVAKYDSAGNVLWARQAGGFDSDIGRGIAVDTAGNSYVTGSFNSTNANFGGIVLTNGGGSDVFVAKYDSVGNVLWAERAGGGANDGGYSIGVDGAGSSYATGFFSSTNASFGNILLTNLGSSDIFVAKYDGTGNVVWAKSAGGSGADSGRGICVLPSGVSYVSGQFSGTAAFGSSNVVSAGSADLFGAKYDSAGNVLWVKSAGGTNSDSALSIAVDAAGHAYLIGNFTATAAFDSTNLTSSGSSDVFVARMDEAALPPRLSIFRVGRQAVVAWPTGAVGFQLENVAILSVSNSWSGVTNLPALVGDQNTVTNDLAGGSRFFRLRKL